MPAPGTLQHTSRYPEDAAVLQAVSGKGVPVVTVLLSGRPLYVNDLLNLSDSFVAAWLPGTEGKGVADVLFRKPGGAIEHDFQGTLSFSWPKSACQTALNKGDAKYDPLFELGYGLNYGKKATLGKLDTEVPVAGCGTATTLSLFNQVSKAPYALYISSADSGLAETALGDDLNAVIALPTSQPALKIRTTQINTQQDAKQVTWLRAGQFHVRSAQATNLRSYAAANGALQFDMMISQMPQGAVKVLMGCGAGCGGAVDLGAYFKSSSDNAKHTVKIPMACFVAQGVNMEKVVMPFGILADKPLIAAFSSIQIVAGAAKDADAVKCGDNGVVRD
ncbi:MAG: hypothetical protein C0406_08420 [Sideroxydans sp.]|nr:hypothetical protein [Sideroxydans sp.]